jgi:formate dehydrogenase subunit delta
MTEHITAATTPIDKLVSMGNQMASFFRAYPEAEAAAGIRDHIQAFWTPRMRAAILAESNHAGLDPLVALALRSWPKADSPIGEQATDPAKAGPLASDAG